MSPSDLQKISQQSCDVMLKLGPQVQWVHSYVTGDKIYCSYNASDETLIRNHADQSGFPANLISEINAVIDPVTAEAPRNVITT